MTIGLGYDISSCEMFSLRLKAFSTLGNRSLINKQYYMYAPGLTTSLVTLDQITLNGILPNSTEMVQITQRPAYGIFISTLYRLSDRFSIGPSYSISRTQLQSYEYLANTSASASSLPYYLGTFMLKNQTFGALWTYKINNQSSMHLGLEASKQGSVAKKEIYFNSTNTSRILPTSTNVTLSNWNGINSAGECIAGADCSLETSKSYESAPYLNLSRILTRISIGVDFFLGQSSWLS